jgi:hypothetical protein
MCLSEQMPYEPVILDLKFAIRVHDLTGPDVLVVTCPDCHKIFNVAPHVIYARFHKHMPLIDVAKQFKCKRCGNKKVLDWLWVALDISVLVLWVSGW